MITLFQAIMSRFNSQVNGQPNAFYQAVGGRLYNTEAPNGVPLPYAVFSLVSMASDYFFDRCLVQFSIFSDAPSSMEVCTAYDGLKSLFDLASITATGMPASLTMERQHAQLVREDEGVWHYIIEYSLWVERV